LPYIILIFNYIYQQRAFIFDVLYETSNYIFAHIIYTGVIYNIDTLTFDLKFILKRKRLRLVKM